MNKYREFENYLKEFPTSDGYFGEFGGAYLPPELVPAFKEADDAYEAICHSAQFINELRRIRKEKIATIEITHRIAAPRKSIFPIDSLCLPFMLHPPIHQNILPCPKKCRKAPQASILESGSPDARSPQAHRTPR